MNNCDEIYILEWNKSKYLVLTSSFFLIPCLYAYFNNLYLLSSILGITSFFSINFWRKATYSIRRTIDICVANMGFVVFFYNGVCYFVMSNFSISMYINTIFIVYCFYLSNVLYENKNKSWYKYHVLFHMCSLYNQIGVIYIISNYEKHKNI